MTRPYDDSWLAEQVEKTRKQMFRPPNPEIAAEAERQRRRTSSRVYAPEFDFIHGLTKGISEKVKAISALGGPAVRVETVDPLDLRGGAAILKRISVLRQLDAELDALIDRLEQTAAQADRERLIAAETPRERFFREQAEAWELRFADLEARLPEPNLAARRGPPARPLPQMSNAPVTHGAMGFVVGIVPPSQVNALAAAHRVGGSAAQDSRPAISNGRPERLGHGDSPDQFQRAIQTAGTR
jgi:hypothetical protein